MGLYTGTNTWIDHIYQFEQTDPVQGGDDGIDNRPLKELADRTRWLRDAIGRITRFENEVNITANTTIDSTKAGHLIVARATSGVVTLTLGDAATFTHGAIVPISSFTSIGSVITILPQSGQPITDPIEGNATVMYMHNKEHLMLIALTNHWKIVSCSGNFYSVGEEVKSRRERNNTIALKGQELQRAQYPRLWLYVQSLTYNQEVVPESTWWWDATTYRSCFSTGNGTSTFRLPDERGLFERMLDLSRGIDTSRGHPFPGGYQIDEFKSHKHPWGYGTERDDDDSGGSYDELTMRPYGQYHGKNGIPDPVMAAGGVETRPKNVAKLNLIKF